MPERAAGDIRGYVVQPKGPPSASTVSPLTPGPAQAAPIPSMGAHVRRKQHTVVGLTATAMALTAAVVAPSSPATAAVTAPVACPAAYPTAAVEEGLVGTGFTVDKGTVPKPFTAEVIGRLTDGVFPGIDMIVAEVRSPALTAAGGVWGGMSGSPVYAPDGRLIGAVAYTLSAGPTNIAGITPAEAMLPLAADSASAATARARLGATRVKVDARMARRIAAASDATVAQAASGFQRIQLPLSVSGGNAKSRQALINKMKPRLSDVRIVQGGAVAEGITAPPSSIRAGGNFVAALSYGDITFAGAGTTTFVCNDRAVAFGHPFLFVNPMRASAHDSTAVYVQPDPLFGPYKLVNPGGVVGTVDRDTLTGISAKLGVAPPTTLVSASLTRLGTRAATTGSSRAVFEPFLPDIAANQLYVTTLKAFGTDSAGSAAITTTITGVRANGARFTLRYADRYSSTGSLAFEVADAAFLSLLRLTNQNLEDVRITSVSFTGAVDTKIRQFRVTKVLVKQGASFVVPGRAGVRVTPGTPLPVRVTLASYRNREPARTYTLSVPVPRVPRGTSGQLTVSAGAVMTGQGPEGPEATEPTTFDQLLRELQTAPRNAEIRAQLDLEDRPSTRASLRVGAAVNGYVTSWSAIS